jgi:O-antigen ligase
MDMEDQILCAAPVPAESAADDAAADAPAASCQPGFVALLAVTATLFVRPSDLIPGLGEERIYLVLIVTALLLSLPVIIPQLAVKRLREQPITACVLGLLAASLCSRLGHFDMEGAIASGFEFAKVVVYYLLVVGLLSTDGRIQNFLYWLTFCYAVLAALSVLDFHGLPDLPTISPIADHTYVAELGGEVIVQRLRGTGIFQDPNDVCLVLVPGILLSLYWASRCRFGVRFCVWLALCGLFSHALALTHSRGGFLGLLAGLGVLFHTRFGWKRTILSACVVIPCLLVLFAGRQTTISTRAGTAQSRLELWRDGLQTFREEPLLGLGKDRIAEMALERGYGHVVHNSYLHSFAELGFAGGCFFLGAFFLGARRMLRLEEHAASQSAPEMLQLRPYLLAAFAAYSVSSLTLSNCYTVPTYMMLGLACAFAEVVPGDEESPPFRLDLQCLLQLAALGLAFLLVTYLFVRVFLVTG